MQEKIEIHGARVNNLKNVDLAIPRDKLVVVTGLSGSGKSSLAFDTLYAEGQRRYMETLSIYVRQYVGAMERPDVDKITGLSPVVAIEQKTTSKNPRSTVGTITEINDFLRLLFARASRAYSPVTGEEMVHYTDDQIIDLIIGGYDGQKVALLAPIVKGRKGHYRELFDTLVRKGFMHARIDGEMTEISSGMKLDRYKAHTIELVVDRLVVKEESRDRLMTSLREAMRQGKGTMMLYDYGADAARYYSRHLMCPSTGVSLPDPAPHSFSFNSPHGACPHCGGLGLEPVPEPDEGDDDEDTAPTEVVERVACTACGGTRLRPEALHFKVGGKNIAELSAMSIAEFAEWIEGVDELFSEKERRIAREIIKEISDRLGFLVRVGLGYLSLARSSRSLSGGEGQRIRLATQIGSRLVNVLYILDEPSIGLHQRDNRKLIDSLRDLRDTGNSVVVVEHDEEMIRSADFVVDVGPGAGRKGGEIVAAGAGEGVMDVPESLSGGPSGYRHAEEAAQGEWREDSFARGAGE